MSNDNFNEEDKKAIDPIVLNETIEKISYTLDRDYLSHLSRDFGILKFENYNKEEHLMDEGNYAGIRIKQFIKNKDEQVIDCFKNILSAFSCSKDTLALILTRKKEAVILDFIYKLEGNNVGEIVNTKLDLLKDAFIGNFPGSKTETLKAEDIKAHFSNLRKEIKSQDGEKEEVKYKFGNVAVLSSIPSDKSENYISQGIEKLLNGVVPKRDDGEDEYSVLILAQSMLHEEVRAVINGFEEMATTITPFITHQFQTGINKSETNGEMKSATDTEGVSHAITKTHSVNVGVNASFSSSNTDGTSITNSEALNQPTKKAILLNAIGPIAKTLGAVGVGALAVATGGFGLAAAPGVMGALKALDTVAKETKTITESITNFKSTTNGQSIGMSAGYGRSWGVTDTNTTSKALTDGTNHSITLGTSDSATYTYKSYLVANLIEKIEKNIKRININQATGMWQCATYVMSQDKATCNNVANFLRGITQGDDSYIETAAIQKWDGKDTNDCETVKEVYEYLSNFTHPIFINMRDVMENIGKELIEVKEFKDKINDINSITNTKAKIIPILPTTNISTSELSKLFSLPNHSLPSLPILECAEFGRNVAKYEKKGYNNNEKCTEITLGKVYHMHDEEKQEVKLDKESFTSHVFVTGSTGSGKSNTVYQLINKLKTNVNGFLIIEPAKGEYKKVFGEEEEINVYGTNPSITKLLKINPFKFPNGNKDASKNIHILEHLDRLIEIFNVCWPMYAAMPAVLKESIEKSYIDAGWDLLTSENKYGISLYPTFEDVCRNVRLIIESSDYDSQNKGAYKGSLITRLNSLSNGINGLVFTNKDDLTDVDLFDKKVIIDLSRVGSSETKSLIMGILILRLQEYRMTQHDSNDSKLKHFTVLEEAHNLLKNTTINQTGEGGNIASKSVEMLTNAIAEMRSYGEGFIIVDQAPGLLDKAVIRNTNTKIIMRLPDLEDRELVGKAANLNDNQIEEIAKLPTGIAAVYQNNWVQPILCSVDEYKYDKSNTFNEENLEDIHNSDIKKRINIVKGLCLKSPERSLIKDSILQDILSLNLSGTVYSFASDYINNSKLKPDIVKLSVLVSNILPEFNLTIRKTALQFPTNIKMWRDELQSHIEQVLRDNVEYSDYLRNIILQCIIENYVVNEINQINLLEELEKKTV